jgi:DNA modification methylase
VRYLQRTAQGDYGGKFWWGDMNKVFFGDCRDSMRQLIAEGIKVQTCVTSPPYWGLRDYGHDGQLGAEDTPEQYVKNMVEVFSLVRELLHDDGTLWLNLGDSYSIGGRTTTTAQTLRGHDGGGVLLARAPVVDYLKPKDLAGIPWLVALALRADGWYLRQDIIWSKPNPMPESVQDRCTKSHEYIFLLSKSQKYYYDNEAIKEPMQPSSIIRNKTGWDGNTNRGYPSGKQNNMDKYLGSEDAMAATHRNKRSVWEVATTPYSGAHFATYPIELIEPCILAGSRPGDVVIDPFFGSGTTGQCAQNLGRQYIGCELNQDYEKLQLKRTAQGGLCLEM